MNTAYLILGSNLGNKIQNLNDAVQLISEEVGTILKKSGVYITAAWGNTDQPDFLNQALSVKTQLSAADLLDSLLLIEKQLGRVRNHTKWTERTLDIDILFYNNDIISKENLKIPHPFIHERKFVLVPLAEIAGSYVHPQLNKSVSQLLSDCVDQLEIAKHTN